MRAARVPRDDASKSTERRSRWDRNVEEGTQLRPDIVWFGEETQLMEEAREHVASADKVLVVGTSLSVYPAAGLVEFARADTEKVLNALEIENVPADYRFLAGPATRIVPGFVDGWLQ